jgi:hypothetical protein
MRACARVALASIAVSASISLSGCAAIEELKETFLRWVESQKLPIDRGVSGDELPEATPVVPPEKTPKEPSKRPTAETCSAQTATAEHCASSKETADPRFHRGGEAGRHRGAIRAV